MTIEILSKKSCVQCQATYRALDRKGLEYVVRDLEEDPAALELARSLGYLQAPIVIAGDAHWSGFRPDQINALANRAIHGLGAIGDA
jgi:glutaredoxin-like protein NrdH